MTNPPIFDGHNDTLTRLAAQEPGEGRSFLHRGENGHLDLPRAREGGLVGGIFAVFTPAPETSKERELTYGLTFTDEGYEVSPRSALDQAYASSFTDSVLDFLDDLQSKAMGALKVVHTHRELEQNLVEDRFSVVLHLEGAEAIRPDLTNLQAYYARGVRSLGLVWSRPNAFGYGVPFRFPHSPDVGPGLTAAGKQLVQACNHLGIVVDLAHINERGFWDVAQLSTAPLVVSHAGVHALCPSTRNLTDEQIDAIGQSGGLIGIIFEPLNLRRDGRLGEETPLTEIVRHVDYVAQRIGVEHVALGSDFDGATMPQALGDVTGLPRLMAALRFHGYDEASLAKIAYGNWLRIFRESWR